MPAIGWWLIGLLVVAGILAVLATVRLRRIAKY